MLPYFRVRVEGLDQLPAAGPVILAINHLSMLDPLIVGALLPRPVHFMAKRELFSFPPLRWFLKRVHAFPVRRGEPDRDALHQALEVLRQGGVVGVFPEGTRSDDGRLLTLHPGTAWLAHKGRAPILPVAIYGTQYAMPRGAWWPRRVPVRVCLGQLLEVERTGTGGARDQVDAVSRELAAVLGKLLQRLTGDPVAS